MLLLNKRSVNTMRKFLLPIINLINVVLCSIVFGLGNNNAYTYSLSGNERAGETWYSLVWMPIENGSNAIGIVGFFLFIFAVAGVLFAFLPIKARKFVNVLVGAMLIASGVLFLKTPMGGQRVYPGLELSGSLIAMAVLVFISGAFSLAMAALEFVSKPAESK